MLPLINSARKIEQERAVVRQRDIVQERGRGPMITR
jgi:hypothetical protein